MKHRFFYLAFFVIILAACNGISPELEYVSGNDNGHDYVDMGVSVMWSPVNMGATVIGEFGEYFAWGEEKTKDYFSFENYKHSNGGQNNYTKYGINPSEGVVDNLTTLEPEDDAAHVQWGGTWRMPTQQEWIELRENCTWEYTRENGRRGWTATAPNGNKIFFPFAGGQHWDENDTKNIYGTYRSSSLGEKYTGTTYNVIFRSHLDGGTAAISWSYGSREFGLSIRPVCAPK